jgi:hypothetical protein
MPNETAVYAAQAGSSSGYAFMRNASIPIAFPSEVTQFQGGWVYTFRYDGSALVLRSAGDILESLNIVSTSAEMAAALRLLNTTNSAIVNIDIAGSFSFPSASLARSGENITLTIKSSTAGEKVINIENFTIGNGVTLVLENNITLQGKNNNTTAAIRVNSGGTLVMNTGSKVSGNSSSSGGGVYVSGGTFTMSDGTISGNTSSYGGGVYVDTNGTFTKKAGGIIYGADASSTLKNTSMNGGHVVYVSSGGKKRNTTAGTGVTLDSSVSGSPGGWE